MKVSLLGNNCCRTLQVSFAFPVQGIFEAQEEGTPRAPRSLVQALLDKVGLEPIGPANAVPKMASADAHVVIDSMVNLSGEERGKTIEDQKMMRLVLRKTETIQRPYTPLKAPKNLRPRVFKATFIHRLSFEATRIHRLSLQTPHCPRFAPRSRTHGCTRGTTRRQGYLLAPKIELSLEDYPVRYDFFGKSDPSRGSAGSTCGCLGCLSLCRTSIGRKCYARQPSS